MTARIGSPRPLRYRGRLSVSQGAPIEPVDITSTDTGAAGRFIELSGAALNDVGAQTVLVYHNPPGTSENGSGMFMAKVPSGTLSGPRFNCSHNAGLPRTTAGFESAVATQPNSTGANSTVTYGTWQHHAMTWDGLAGVDLNDDDKVRLYAGVGVSLDLMTQTQQGGTAPITSDAANPMYLMNRLGLLRAYVGDIAYIAMWERVLSPAELVTAQNSGPLSLPSGLLFVYANGQIYDPNNKGITIANRSARVTGALPPNVTLASEPPPVEFMVHGDFERSSVDTGLSGYSGTGDSAVISIRPKMQANETVNNELRWLVPSARVTGLLGKRPTFRFTNYGSTTTWQFPWDAQNVPYFRYLGGDGTWIRFSDGVTVGANTMTFRHGSAFTADGIELAAQRTWTPTQHAAWIASIAAAYPALVQNVPSNIDGFVSGYFDPQTDILGRTCPVLPFHAFCIKDDSLQPDGAAAKRTMVLVGGTHAGEDIGDFMFMAQVEFLLSNDPMAVNLRKHFVTYCYSQINAPGRWLGGFRGGWVTEPDGGNDANRNFNQVDTQLDIVLTPRAAMEIDLPAHVHVSCDNHGNWGFNRAMYNNNGANGTAWINHVAAVMSPLSIDDYGPSSDGSITHYMGTVRTADFWTTAEGGEVSSQMTPNDVATFGTAIVKAVSTMLDAGLIPAA